MADETARSSSPEAAAPADAKAAARAQARAEDGALIDRALASDAKAYEELFEKYREKVYRVIFGYVHDKDEALDIAQEAFIKAFKNLPSFERESGFYTWLTRIAINLAIDFRRKRARRKVIALEDYMDPQARPHGAGSTPRDPAHGVQDKELKEAYFRALEVLSEKHRTVFLLHTVEGMAYKEIAASLDISIGTVMSRLHYARKHLQELLAEHLR